MEKAYIRRLEKNDYDDVCNLIENDDKPSFFSFDATYYTKDIFFHLINQMEIAKRSMQYGIFHKDQLVGVVSLHDIDAKEKSGEYSIYLKPDYQHKGFASQATTFILTEAFERMKLHHVYLRVDLNNETAIRFYERFGFVPCKSQGNKAEHGFLCYEMTEDRLY